MVSTKKSGRPRSKSARSKKQSSRRKSSTSSRKGKRSGSKSTKGSRKKLPKIPVWYHEPQIKYRLSDERFISLGWTQLPGVSHEYVETTIKKKLITYKTIPSKPNVFTSHGHHENKYYTDGSPLAVFKKNGMGSIYYPDGHVAITRQKTRYSTRYTVFSPGGRDPNTNLKRCSAICGLFDSFGNGVIYDAHGEVLLKYNQKRGMLSKNNHGVPVKWTWPNEFTEEKHLAELERGEWLLDNGKFKHVVTANKGINNSKIRNIEKVNQVSVGSDLQVKSLLEKRSKSLIKDESVIDDKTKLEEGHATRQLSTTILNQDSISSIKRGLLLLDKKIEEGLGEVLEDKGATVKQIPDQMSSKNANAQTKTFDKKDGKLGSGKDIRNETGGERVRRLSFNEELDNMVVVKKSSSSGFVSFKEPDVKRDAKSARPLRSSKSTNPEVKLRSSLKEAQTFIKKEVQLGKKNKESLSVINEEKEVESAVQKPSHVITNIKKKVQLDKKNKGSLSIINEEKEVESVAQKPSNNHIITNIKTKVPVGKKSKESLSVTNEEKEVQSVAQKPSVIHIITSNSLTKHDNTSGTEIRESLVTIPSKDSVQLTNPNPTKTQHPPKKHPVVRATSTPIQPIVMKLNEFMTLRVADQENVALVFSAQKHTLRIELGVQVDTTVPARVDKYSYHVSDSTHMADKAINYFELIPTKSLVQVAESLAKRRAYAVRKKTAAAAASPRNKFR